MVVEESRAEEIFKAVQDMVNEIAPFKLLSEEEYYKMKDYGATSFFDVGIGAEAILKVLQQLDLDKISASLKEESQKKTTGQRYIKITKRLRVGEGLRLAKLRPEWMVLRVLPVLPPELRPMVQLSGGRFATSDLNDLYRRVINRNNRLKRLMELGAPEIILRNEKRMLQEAVDALIDTADHVHAKTNSRVKVLRSLSDMLRGKQGRFRQNLLGKRVDYSGRSVIVVGPKLSLHQTGLPKEMALEMFKPFVLRDLIAKGLAPNMRSAKHVIESRRAEVWDILEEITKNHPVLLNRAPTLHRLGFQAFYPILIEGNAIQLHPCVCSGFGADFDGDQMAVHIPLSLKTQEEAARLMLSTKNLLKPADGAPVTLPNKEMAMGCFYLTTIDESIAPKKEVLSPEEAICAYQNQKLALKAQISVKMGKEIIETTVGRLLFNEILPVKLGLVNDVIKFSTIKALILRCLDICNEEETTQVIDSIKQIGFWGATISGVSTAVDDFKVIKNKEEIIKEADKRVGEIERNLRRGLITREEQRRLSNEIWMETTDKIADLTWQNFTPDNPVKILIESGGSRATGDQIKQMAGMRGLVADPTGRIVELPTRSNFKEGLSVFEYFTSARGGRKGLADKALKTSEAGYLTRRLVDVAHDVIVRTEDCGTKKGIEILRADKHQGKSFASRIINRLLAENVVDPKTKKVLIKAGEELSEKNVGLIEKAQIEKIVVRSPLSCEAPYGICATCYGRDLASRKQVALGVPVGVIAAQSIGEPGTQLTMRTFHLGGIVGLDITQGLPRVEELFEARTPKVLAPIAEISGKVSVVETDEGYHVTVKTVNIKPPEEREYILPATAELKANDGDLIVAGQPLVAGYLDLKQILEIKGLWAAQKYIIDSVQEVYESQGVTIHDKHFEVIVRKMCDKVRIKTAGDTNLLPGELVEKIRFEKENARVLAEGGEPATAQIIILGITRGAINTESFLSAASFQETTHVLTDAAISGKIDRLLGLKENVIIGRLIPTDSQRARLSDAKCLDSAA